MLGRLHHVILDCPNPAALAGFYSRLLGQPITYQSGHRRPTWPDPAGHPFCLIRRPGWAPSIPPGDQQDTIPLPAASP